MAGFHLRSALSAKRALSSGLRIVDLKAAVLTTMELDGTCVCKHARVCICFLCLYVFMFFCSYVLLICRLTRLILCRDKFLVRANNTDHIRKTHEIVGILGRRLRHKKNAQKQTWETKAVFLARCGELKQKAFFLNNVLAMATFWVSLVASAFHQFANRSSTPWIGLGLLLWLWLESAMAVSLSPSASPCHQFTSRSSTLWIGLGLLLWLWLESAMAVSLSLAASLLSHQLTTRSSTLWIWLGLWTRA